MKETLNRRQIHLLPSRTARGGAGRDRDVSGFTLIEVIFYILLFTVLFGIIMQTLFTISGTHNDIAVTANTNETATLAVERIAREIRDAHHVITAGSTLGSAPGTLKLAMTSDASETHTIYQQDEQIHLDKNGSSQGPLTPSHTDISNLTFYHITTSDGPSAVRFSLTTTASSSNETKTVTFYNTAALRGSYQ